MFQLTAAGKRQKSTHETRSNAWRLPADSMRSPVLQADNQSQLRQSTYISFCFWRFLFASARFCFLVLPNLLRQTRTHNIANRLTSVLCSGLWHPLGHGDWKDGGVRLTRSSVASSQEDFFNNCQLAFVFLCNLQFLAGTLQSGRKRVRSRCQIVPSVISFSAIHVQVETPRSAQSADALWALIEASYHNSLHQPNLWACNAASPCSAIGPEVHGRGIQWSFSEPTLLLIAWGDVGPRRNPRQKIITSNDGWNAELLLILNCFWRLAATIEPNWDQMQSQHSDRQHALKPKYNVRTTSMQSIWRD